MKAFLSLRAAGSAVAGLFLIGVLGMLARPRSPYGDCFLEKLKGPVKEDSMELLRYIQDQILIPPSSLPYNLEGVNNPARLVQQESESFYIKGLKELFRDKEGLFFVEAGALDGEAMSNTLSLEEHQGWTGLLVEADPESFAALQSKHRKAWTANVCLSPEPYPSQKVFLSTSHHDEPLSMSLGYKARAMNGLVAYASGSKIETSWFSRVQCIPLQSLLLALNVSTVDLLVLDVEGAEMGIIKHLDLDKFNVQVMFVEWKNESEMLRIIKDMKSRGYLLHSGHDNDLVLVRIGSPYEKLINETVARAIPDSWKTKFQYRFMGNNLPSSVR